MTTKNMIYDHASYIYRGASAMGEIGGANTTQYAKFAAFTAMLAFSAQLTVTTAGTLTSHTVAISKISGTATTALGTATLGTSTAGATQNLLLSTALGGVTLLQGDILVAVTGPDTVGKAALSYETQIQPLANVTA